MNDELLFVFVEAWLRRQRPRERVAFLKEVSTIIDNWPKEPIPIRGTNRPSARQEAAATFRERLPKLLG